jgi:hypothetical protein
MSKKQPSSFWIKAIITEVVAAGGILAVIGTGDRSAPQSTSAAPTPPSIAVAHQPRGMRGDTAPLATYAWADPAGHFPNPTATPEFPPLPSSWRNATGGRRTGPPLIDPSRR